MGTAVHAALEAWERAGRLCEPDEVRDVFRTVYREEIDELLEETPNTRYWESSGPYDGAEDIPRRMAVGLEHVDRALAWYEKHPEQQPLVLPDGKLGIELDFWANLGGVWVRGVIDYLGIIQTYADKPALIGPRDNKTGAKPGQVMQLKIYGIVLEDHYDSIGTPTPIPSGDFFMTKSGKPTVLQNLAQITRDEVVVKFQELDANVQAGDFPAKPSEDVCRRCSVRDGCPVRAV